MYYMPEKVEKIYWVPEVVSHIEVIGCCELPSVCARKWTLVLCQEVILTSEPSLSTLFLYSFILFGTRVFLYSPCCPGTCHVDQVGLKLAEIHLPLPPNTGITCHHIQQRETVHTGFDIGAES